MSPKFEKEKNYYQPFNKIAEPYGGYHLLYYDNKVKVRYIWVHSGAHIERHYHKERNETWTVIKGIASITHEVLQPFRIEHEYDLKVGDPPSVMVKFQEHRIANNQDSELAFIETQTGDYIGEDDVFGEKR